MKEAWAVWSNLQLEYFYLREAWSKWITKTGGLTKNPAEGGGILTYKMWNISEQNKPDLIMCLFQAWLWPLLAPAGEPEGHVEAPGLQEERKQESLSSKFVIGQIFS